MARSVTPESLIAARQAQRLARDKWLEFLGWLQLHQGTRWVFRGEPNTRTPLRPAIGRGPNWAVEREYLLYEQFEHKSRLLRAANGTATFIEQLAWAQHHGLPTRLLDWTTNPLAAAYFAVHAAKQGPVIIHAVDAAEVRFFRHSEIADAVRARSLFETRFVEVPPLSARMTAQRGLFSWHHRPDENWKPVGRDKFRDCFEIPPEARRVFAARLSELGFDAAAIMMDLDGLCASLRWWYQSGLATPSTIGRRVRPVTSRKTP